jgi:hypothetical protein
MRSFPPVFAGCSVKTALPSPKENVMEVKTKEALDSPVSTRKVVVNRCFGGFSLSDAGVRLYAKLKGLTLYPEKDDKFSFTTYWTVPPEERQAEPAQEEWLAWTMERRQEHMRVEKSQEVNDRDIPRDDPALVETVETLGDEANGMCADLRVVAIPADVEWQIEEYDGREHIAEAHRTW